MVKFLQAVCICGVLLVSCKDKVICPAFQSTYILDDSTRLAYYSIAWKLDESSRQEYLSTYYGASASTESSPADPTEALDTTSTASIGDEDPMLEYFAHVEQYVSDPEVVRKSKYGIIKREPLILKNYKLKTAPMENVLGPPDEELEEVEVGEFVADDFVETDSTGEVGDLPVAVQEEAEQRYRFKYNPKDSFNVDQEYYNKYFGELFIDDSPLPEPPSMEEELIESDTASTEKKGIFGGGLFGKKKKKKKDKASDEDESEAEAEVPEEEVPEKDPE